MASFAYRYLPALGISAFEAYLRLGAESPGFVLEGASQEPGASRFSFAASGVDRVLRSDDTRLRDEEDPFEALRRELALLSDAIGGLEVPVAHRNQPCPDRLRSVGSATSPGSRRRQGGEAWKPTARQQGLELAHLHGKKRGSPHVDRFSPPSPASLAGPVGYFAYETAEHVESGIRSLPADPTGAPEAAFFAPSDMVVVDQWTGDAYVLVVSHDRPSPGPLLDARADAIAHRLCNTDLGTAEAFTARLNTNASAPSDLPQRDGRGLSDPAVRQRLSQPEYEAMVERARDAVIEGELIQAVLSQRIERRAAARPIDIYRALRQLNPSPYMYLLDFGDFQIVGASPELLVRVRGRKASIHPIAGTRPRGSSLDEDRFLAQELSRSEKDRAEHLMLLDLARNDLGRVCKPGTVDVTRFMAVERYSHVMHLVSRVWGDLGDGLDGLDALAAGFPAGTLTGAPKVRAMELISELEPEGRGPYTGAVGWFGATGSLDSATVIRSMVIRDGIAHIQGGGGIVFDSEPTAEYFEAWQKMEAPLRAIEAAELLGSGPWRITPQAQFSRASA